MKYIKKYNDYKLFEAISVKQIKEQYKDIPNKIFVELIKCDPYTKILKNLETGKYNLTNLGKYGISMLNIYNNLESSQEKQRLINEDLPKAKEYIELLYKYRNAVKVNYTDVDSMNTLFNIAKRFMLSKDNVNIKILLDNLEKDIDYFTLLNGDKWYIFKPISEKGACVLGTGTQWCTAWGQYSTNPEYKERLNHFKTHNNQGPLYILINKDDNSDKYQFHFESKQFKNKYDYEIDKQTFIETNEEIKKFYFPSLFGLEGDFEKQFEKIILLNSKDISELITKIYGYKNKLAAAILSKDEDKVLTCYKTNEDDEDTFLYNEIDDLNENEIVFISELSDDMEDVKDELEILRNQEYNASDNVYSSIHEMSDDENFFDDLCEKIFKEYFDANFDSKIYKIIGKISFEKFKDRYYDQFRKDEKIIEGIKEIISDNSVDEYEQECKEEINKIKKYIDFEYNSTKSFRKSNKYNITIPIPYLLKYILTEEIDEISNTSTFIEEYMSHYKIWASHDAYIYVSYNTEEVSYKKHTISTPVDAFFEEIYDKINVAPLTPEQEDERKDKLNMYNNIVKKYFNPNMTYHNKNLSIGINYFDEQNLLVNVSIHFNKTHKEYRGNISIEQFINYITHEDLFD